MTQSKTGNEGETTGNAEREQDTGLDRVHDNGQVTLLLRKKTNKKTTTGKQIDDRTIQIL